MANKIVLKKSSVTSKIPLVTDLDYGELALNYADGKLYYKTSANAIDSFSAGSGGGSTDSFKTIAVAGQSSVVADSSTDTLTISAGSGISITTNASTDTVTITNTGAGGVLNVSARAGNVPISVIVGNLTVQGRSGAVNIII